MNSFFQWRTELVELAQDIHACVQHLLRFIELIDAGSLEGIRRWGNTHERLLEDVRRACEEFSAAGVA